MSQERKNTQTDRRLGGTDETERAIARRRELVDEAIPEELPVEQPETLHEGCRYLLDAGGKRLRPAVLLLAAESLADVRPERANYRALPGTDARAVDVLRAAVAVEALHTFTLIHDDIMDDDSLRRGVPAVHEAYDDSRAILAGDALYAKAFELLLGTGAPDERAVGAAAQLARTCTRICEGQSLDLTFESHGAADREEYLQMVGGKTAALYATAVSLPATLLGHESAAEPLTRYGHDVGRAFQIQDDLLDLTAASETLGKQRGSDLVEDKETLVTVHAREQGVDVDNLVAAESAAGLEEAAVEAAVEELRAAGSVDYARRTARDLVASGKSHLDALPDNEARGHLAAVADYLLEREH